MLMQMDAAQLEWRVAVELSNELTALEEIIKGEDTHAKNQQAFDLPSRLIAKIFLFRTIFRGSGWSFANDPDFMHVSSNANFWEDMNAKFYAKYSNLDKQHKVWAEIVMKGNPIVGPLGRSWTIPVFTAPDGSRKIPWTTLSNYPVQGTGADIMMLVRLMAYKKIKEQEIPCDFISTVHDSIVLDVPDVNSIPELVKTFNDCFAALPALIKQVFGYEWKVPMACECKMGLNMKDMKKIA